MPQAARSAAVVGSGAVAWQAARAIEVLRARYRDPALNLLDVAHMVGVSRCYLCRLLCRSTGRGSRWHLREVRLSAARQLLDETPLSVKQLAFTVGYRHPSDFVRQFRERFGMTPGRFRGAGSPALSSGSSGNR